MSSVSSRIKTERVIRYPGVSPRNSSEKADVELTSNGVTISEMEFDVNRPLPSAVTYKRCLQLDHVQNLKEAVHELQQELDAHIDQLGNFPDGILRLEVNLPGSEPALSWLRRQVSLRDQSLAFYFSSRAHSVQDTDGSSTDGINGLRGASSIGTSWVWKGESGTAMEEALFEEVGSFLDEQFPTIRCMGISRFDCARISDVEWEDFGSYMFFIPAIEYSEFFQNCTLACNVAWKSQNKGWSLGSGASNANESIKHTLSLLEAISITPLPSCIAPRIQELSEGHMPTEEEWKGLVKGITESLLDVKSVNALTEDPTVNSAMQECLESGQDGLDAILMSLNASIEIQGTSSEEEETGNLSKLVLSRKTVLSFKGKIDIFYLLHHLQQLDPCSYQFCLSLPHGGGSFLGSTPERLYRRQGLDLSTEAIAGRLELLRSSKDHIEFTLVRDWLHSKLQSLCLKLDLEIPKSLIKKQFIQHLYGRFKGVLKDSVNDYELLKTLHPTPAVCGRPRTAAMEQLNSLECFDRGLYAGPVGWISGQGSEFAVAIRSMLYKGTESSGMALVYGGVGIVKHSNAIQEWKEAQLKIRPFKKLLTPTQNLSLINRNLQGTCLIIEELCRNGIQRFCVAPGSRSSPLVFAIASNPSCQVLSCVDERVLGFWSLGYAKATGQAAPVVTSSGTAVGNLLPSVIEASLSWIPMLLLTADRPAELRQSRANQTIDQVEIFGNYVRYFHDVPADYGVSKLRSLLTLTDSAILHSCSNPPGPVHLNFQFNEPLAPVQESCSVQEQDPLVEQWWSSARTYTDTKSVQNSVLSEKLDLRSVSRGLIVVGELQNQEERTAVKKVCTLLGWPSLVDILSGLKSKSEHFILTADQILSENEAVFESLRPDFVLQIGGHITSKRVMKFLEKCRMMNPELQWILVSPNSLRDDPLHLVTRQITIPFTGLTRSLIGDPESNSEFLKLWKSIDDSSMRALRSQLSFLALQETPCEPYVAYLVTKNLPYGHSLFLGNGMPIRDAEMYSGVSQEGRDHEISFTGANRGASGIDGVMSTAIGFASGSKQPTTLVIGDLSFLHDSNALSLLRTNIWPPMTIVVVNNNGGGIFDFLPIAQTVPSEMYDALWSTPQYFNISNLCQAHGVPYQQVTKTNELEKVLKTAWNSNRHCVVEVITNRKENVQIHRKIKIEADRAVQKQINLQEKLRGANLTICELQWTQFSYQLTKPITTGVCCPERLGIHLQVTLRDKEHVYKGIGEICPLPGLHKETLESLEPQLRLLKSLLEGLEIPSSICMMNGSLNEWLMDVCGISSTDMSPSLRFGLDCALLSAFASSMDCQLHQLGTTVASSQSLSEISVNGLLVPTPDHNKTLSEALQLVHQGYQTIKVKVGRFCDPVEEAKIINKISEALGSKIKLRLDANQKWTLSEALLFASELHCGNHLEYIEEPLNDIKELEAFHEQTGLPIALDESLNSIESDHELLQLLQECPGVIACVMKPSKVGSMDHLVTLMEAASCIGVKIIITSSFESPVGLSILAQIAGVANSIKLASNETQKHGLGTCSWFTGLPQQWGCLMETKIPLEESWRLTRSLQLENKSPLEVNSCFQRVQVSQGEYYYHWLEAGGNQERPVLVFLHGFLGSCSDWKSTMSFFSEDYRCLLVDLPGHGLTNLSSDVPELFHFDNAVKSLKELLKSLGVCSCSLIGYSMGARLAAALVSTTSEEEIQFEKLVLISGSLGIQEHLQRATRLVQDTKLAAALYSNEDLEEFLHRWYENNSLWNPLRKHTLLFKRTFKRRLEEGDFQLLSQALVGMSTGRMQYLKTALQKSPVGEIAFVYGELDRKIKGNVKKLSGSLANRVRFIEVENSGHAIQIEAPLKLCQVLSEFL
eukprot:g6725.t1